MQIVDEIGKSIVRGDRQAGDTFPSEPELGVQLGVSRTVIREAIKILGEKGLVESHVKTGAQIQPRHKWNLLDPDILAWEYDAGPRDAFLYKLSEVRRVIEPSAAKLAAIRATDDEISFIEQAYQQMAANLNDIDAFINADMQFHAGIVKASHNEILEQIVNTIREALVASRKVTLQLPNSGYESLPQHYAIWVAIKEHDEVAAQNAMEALINSVKTDLDRSIELIETPPEG
ncbi:MAG: FadR/GntR family transcriptional regulator [Chloroflexota bacterium]